MQHGRGDAMTALDVATWYAHRGWSVVPIAYRDKKCLLTGWQELRLTVADLPDYFNGQAQNVGVLLGEPSGGLQDVDLDCREAVRAAPLLLPPTGSVFG